ncbi:hypothetical protein [Brevibacillus sp. NRS-1366]|uniref:hypothetical protein n=1 Tax=Brevibacillus sp. NRS-1366 TaxID=3233899 RepID=UPI003D1DF7E4
MGTTYANWAYMFVVNDGKIYIVSDSQVDLKQIGSKVGEVTKYSDQESTYSGNFSNRYPKGTEYYEIIGNDLHEAIAVKENEGQFIKANFQGEYAGSKYDWRGFLPYIVGVLFLFVFIYLIKQRLKKEAS